MSTKSFPVIVATLLLATFSAKAAEKADPAMQKSIAISNASPMSFSPAELEKLFAAEYEKWSKVIKAAKIKPD